MKKHLCLLLLASGISTSAIAQEREYSYLEREIDYLMTIWPGDFDNVEQTSFDSAAGIENPNSGGKSRVHVQVSQLLLPDLGDNVLSVQEYRDNDPSNVVRNQVYVLSPDDAENKIRVEVYSLENQRHVLLTDCDILVHRVGDAFIGSTRAETCVTGKRFVRISTDQLWVRDDILDRGGQGLVEEHESWHQLERARWFACMVDFPPEGGDRPTVTHHYIKIHDQGGVFPFTHPDGRDMVLLMRNTWSYGMRRETFFIGVLDGSESGPTLVYSWGNPGADRIGVNPGYLRIQCDLDTEEHVEMQHGLRPDS